MAGCTNMRSSAPSACSVIHLQMGVDEGNTEGQEECVWNRKPGLLRISGTCS
jgi:hypothetical protein